MHCDCGLRVEIDLTILTLSSLISSWKFIKRFCLSIFKHNFLWFFFSCFLWLTSFAGWTKWKIEKATPKTKEAETRFFKAVFLLQIYTGWPERKRLYWVPPLLFVFCNFCKTSLSSPTIKGVPMQELFFFT